MLSRCRNAFVDKVNGFCCAVAQSFWTILYFVYFLFKGKPEWKCETLPETPKNCCVESKSTQSSPTKPIHLSNSRFEPLSNSRFEPPSNSRFEPPSNSRFEPPSNSRFEPPSNSRSEPLYARRGITLMQRLTEKLQGSTTISSDYGRRIGRFCQRIIPMSLQAVQTVMLYLWAFLKTLFYTSVPSKTLSSAAKPYLSKASESVSFSKAEFNANDLNAVYEMESINNLDSDPRKQSGDSRAQFTAIPSEQHDIHEEEVPVERAVPIAMPRKSSKALYQDNSNYAHQQDKQHFPDASLHTHHTGTSACIEENPMNRSKTPPPPTPPPPAPPPPSRPLRIEGAVHGGMEDVDQCDRETYQNNGTTQKRKDPPGIGKLPPEVMAELHGTQKMRQEKEVSVQREMTQSCHPDMAQWKTTENDSRYDRSASATPFRASSVGPTMRRLEQVVSRLDDSSDNEAQYVFRVKPSEYTMGNAVFMPVDEVEKIRDGINRMPNYESRPITPTHSVVSGRFTPFGHEAYAPSTYKSDENGVRRRARTVDPFSRESMPRTTSSFYANSPVTSHTVRRTPVAFDRGRNFAYDRGGVTQGSVSGCVSRWPPASNATGAEVMKDDWVKDVLKENDNGLMTTMCRRIVERKTEDKWRWLDDHGHLLDEKNQRTWKGELDTVLRDGPGEAKHWRRTVESLPSGDTRFQDVSRQYSNNYVVESIVRNY